MDSALIDFFERIGRGKTFYLVERLSAIQTLPVMYGPVLEIHLDAVVVFLKKICSPAKGAHDRFHMVLSPDLPFRRNLLVIVLVAASPD